MTEIELARTVFIAFFVLLLGAAWLLPRSYVYRGAPDGALWRDLRWWTLVLVAVHVAVYVWL